MFSVLLDYYDSDGLNQDCWEYPTLDEAEDQIELLSDAGFAAADIHLIAA